MYNHFENHHHFLIERKNKHKMTKIYIYQAFLTFVKALIGLFIPVYMFKEGIPFTQILIWSSINSISYLILIPFATRIINKLGFKWTIIFSSPFYILQLILINYIHVSQVFIYTSALCFGTYCALFWPAYHSEIVMNGSRKHRASQIGTLQILAILLSATAPAIGGFLLENFPYYYSLLLSLILLLIGSIPLLISEDIEIKRHKFPFSRYVKLYKQYKNKSERFAFSSEGINGVVALVIFPIFLFIMLDNNLLYLGSFMTISSILICIVLYFSKKHIDRKDKQTLLKIITKIISTSWIVKFFFLIFASPIIIIIEGFHKLFENIFTMPYFSIFYNNARKKGELDYIIYRELMIHTTKTFFAIFCIILISIFNIESLKFVILVCVISYILEGMLKER
jgi:MFS family permease